MKALDRRDSLRTALTATAVAAAGATMPAAAAVMAVPAACVPPIGLQLTRDQQHFLDLPGSKFFYGPSGCGKTFVTTYELLRRVLHGPTGGKHLMIFDQPGGPQAAARELCGHYVRLRPHFCSQLYQLSGEMCDGVDTGVKRRHEYSSRGITFFYAPKQAYVTFAYWEDVGPGTVVDTMVRDGYTAGSLGRVRINRGGAQICLMQTIGEGVVIIGQRNNQEYLDFINAFCA